MRIVWNEDLVKKTKNILAKHTSPDAALRDLHKQTGMRMTADGLASAFRRCGMGKPSSYCKLVRSDAPIGAPNENITKLFKITKNGPVSFESCCDKMDLSPKMCRSLVELARSQGVQIHLENDHIGIKATEPSDRVKNTGIQPVVGKRQKVAVISDTHLGSKYCLREQLQEFVHYAYEQGVREILHPGDCLDGQYKHGIFEVSHTGIEEQTQDLFETLPKLPGLTYHGILGNHDNTFTESSGVEVGSFISNYFSRRGRDDFKFYGNRGAFIKIRGAVIHLWHPRSGMSYAKSYGIQKQIEKYTVVKPHITLTGHWHSFAYITTRGVHGITCPTFQGGGSAFGKSIGGCPDIGGLLLSWDMTSHGTLRSFVLERRTYFEVEKPVSVENEMDGIRVIA